ncbi:hypothetical protein ABZ851_14110 [Streptomyces sp. NPDC047049]
MSRPAYYTSHGGTQPPRIGNAGVNDIGGLAHGWRVRGGQHPG